MKTSIGLKKRQKTRDVDTLESTEEVEKFYFYKR